MERGGQASVARGNGGIRLSLLPTWDSRHPPRATAAPWPRDSENRNRNGARPNPIWPLPARFAACSRPSSKPKRFLRAENAPFPPPPCTSERDRLEFSREIHPLPQLVSARTGKEEGAPGESAADAIILCFSAAPTSTSCLRPACLQPIGNWGYWDLGITDSGRGLASLTAALTSSESGFPRALSGLTA